MKNLILAAALVLAGTSANSTVLKQSVPGDTVAGNPGWVPMTTVCYIGDDLMSAKIACEDDMEIINLISTSRVVMNSTCVRADKYCPMKSQFMLVTNVFARHP